MTAHLKFAPIEAAELPAYYRGIAHDFLQVAWRRKALIALFAAGGVAAAAVALVVAPPKYTSEAILQVNFNRDSVNAARTQRIASADALALVETSVRILRSRALASAVVTRLGLETDPGFSRAPRLLRIVWSARRLLGLPVPQPTAREIAVDRLMGALRVGIEPRSYIITVAISASQPDRAALIVNAVALEYLRAQQLQHFNEVQRSIERDIAELEPIYGDRHPKTAEAQGRLIEVQARIADLREASDIDQMIGTSDEFFPAEVVGMPSGPSFTIILVAVLSLSLLACGATILFLELRSASRRSH